MYVVFLAQSATSLMAVIVLFLRAQYLEKKNSYEKGIPVELFWFSHRRFFL